MELIKFRIYDPTEKRMIESGATPTMLASFFRATAVLNVRDGMEYQQFINVLDKSDKEIYKGDIIKHNQNLFVVKWSTNLLGWVLRTSEGMNWRDGEWIHNVKKYIEIIGNITENPELLEVLDE